MSGGSLRRCSATLMAVALLAGVTSACDFSGPAPRAELVAAATVPTGVVSPKQVRLHHGRNTQTHNAITTETILLPPRAHGDLDGDGYRDTAALVQTRARLADSDAVTGTTQVLFLSAVVFRNPGHAVTGGVAHGNAGNGGVPIVSNALALGPGARVHDIDIFPAELDRHSPLRATPARLVVDYTLPTGAYPAHRQQLTAKLTGNTLTPMNSTVTTKIDATATVQPTQLVLMPDGSATDDGVSAYGATQHYEFTVNAGYRMTLAATSAQAGIRLAVRGVDGTVLLAAERGQHSFHGTAPTSQRYRIDVSSSAPIPARYTLKVTVAKPRPGNTTIPGRADSGKVLHLTFDDGPHPKFTDEVLEVLARYGAKATFFVSGNNVAAGPELVDRTLATGHVVANHGYTHRKLTGVSRQTFDDEVNRTQQALGGRGAACFRPPYGATDAQLRQRTADLGLDLVLWDVDTQDWRRGPPEEIAKRIIDGAQSGNIVLMHDGGGDRSSTVQALEIALPKLVEQGWSFTAICR